METENIERILEACDTLAYEYSYKYKPDALSELSKIKADVARLKENATKKDKLLAEIRWHICGIREMMNDCRACEGEIDPGDLWYMHAWVFGQLLDIRYAVSRL